MAESVGRSREIELDHFDFVSSVKSHFNLVKNQEYGVGSSKVLKMRELFSMSEVGVFQLRRETTKGNFDFDRIRCA